jgi:hypothetical protein
MQLHRLQFLVLILLTPWYLHISLVFYNSFFFSQSTVTDIWECSVHSALSSHRQGANFVLFIITAHDKLPKMHIEWCEYAHFQLWICTSINISHNHNSSCCLFSSYYVAALVLSTLCILSSLDVIRKHPEIGVNELHFVLYTGQFKS